MILKGSQRGNGADLATHLMQALDNESVEIAEIYGTVAGDLHGAFAEIQAIAAGTRARNYLYSLSINPSAPLTREQYEEAIQDIEDRLGLTAQPRAVVFHIKDGREHCHVVWSKIDAASMKAIHMPYDHSRLCDLSCELARKFDLDLPPGLKAWEARQRREKEILEVTMAENAIAKETGLTPAQRQAEITSAYNTADTADGFRNALLERGYILAKGDKRGLVVLDPHGKAHSLTRYVKGHRAKDIKNRLSALDPASLPSADQARAQRGQRQQAVDNRRREKARAQAMETLRQRHAKRRQPLLLKEQELLVTHAAERLALHAAQAQEALKAAETEGALFSRVKNAVLRLLHRMPGLRSVLAPFVRDHDLDRTERHVLENKALQERHERERAMIAREKRSMAAVETRELRALERALGRSISEGGQRDPRIDPAIHERESLHRLHVHLQDIRAFLREPVALTPYFNERAGLKKHRDREGEGRPPQPDAGKNDPGAPV